MGKRWTERGGGVIICLPVGCNQAPGRTRSVIGGGVGALLLRWLLRCPGQAHPKAQYVNTCVW